MATPTRARWRKPGETPACARRERPCGPAVLLRGCPWAFCHVHDRFVSRADGLTGLAPVFPCLFRRLGTATAARTEAPPPAGRAHRAAGPVAARRRPR